jgi:ketosteroid isomerase-like protein
MKKRDLAEFQILDSGKTELSERNIEITTSAFHELIEKKNISTFSNLMSPKLKIRKNNELWNYDQTFTYIEMLISKYKKVTFLPFEMVIATGDYVTVKFTERLFLKDGRVESHKFISIFEIKEGRIQNIWELAVPADEILQVSKDLNSQMTYCNESINQL